MNFKIYVAGWYFFEYRQFYRELLKIKDHVHVGSHGKIPSQISSAFKSKEYENIGHGWGLFEQIRLDKEFSEIDEQDFVIFIQDDTTILNLNFYKALAGILEDYPCAGNSIELPKYHPFQSIVCDQRYAKGNWFEKARSAKDFQYQIVDGRCFALKTETLTKINGMEDTYWGTDPRGSNSSLRLFSAKLSTFYGKDCHGFLSDDWRKSQYLLEDKAPDSFYTRTKAKIRKYKSKFDLIINPRL